MFQIEEELKKLPGKPGVYIMHGEKDEIIYVGKAVSLKNRVRQYFQSSRNKGAKIEQMVTHITRFEYIITDSELEALVLECNLIKEHRPKYNTMLKDDKSYPFIKVTVNEEYPRVLFARRMKKDKAKYFGPYTSAGAVKDVIELVRKLYKVRSCNRVLPRDCGKDRPCLYYHMKQCSAPCQGYVSSEEYKKNIAELLKFLNGDFKDTIDMLTDKMMAASEEMRFEDAMEYRDLIRSIQKIGERQKITGYGEEDKDIIAVAMDESLDLREQDAVVQVFFVRGGKLIGREHFYLRVARGDTKAQVLSSFMKQFYAGTPFIPREIMLQKEIEDARIFSATLLPMDYYRALLSTRKDDYGIYVTSPFRQENRCILTGRDVSSRYTRRGYEEYHRIASYIARTVWTRKGNYMVFFPSYKFMEDVLEVYENEFSAEWVRCISQTSGMNEREKEEFLEEFSASEGTLVGFCVMGGIFSEGIDLMGEKLIGAIIIGTGLPQIGTEREILRQYYDKKGVNGFDYAYRYPGMNKVLQSAGRVIRTQEDTGIILLLDERFTGKDYRNLFPAEWSDRGNCTLNTVEEKLGSFWNRIREKN